MAKKKRRQTPPAEGPAAGTRKTDGGLVSRHLWWGWWMLAIFLTLGLLLEALHGFKVDAYLGVANATRRLMWTLAHAHGTLLGLVHVAFAATVRIGDLGPEASLDFVSRGLIVAGLVLPAGFFLGGLVFHEGDPGLGVLLVPVGGILLAAVVVLIARRTGTGSAS